MWESDPGQTFSFSVSIIGVSLSTLFLVQRFFFGHDAVLLQHGMQKISKLHLSLCKTSMDCTRILSKGHTVGVCFFKNYLLSVIFLLTADFDPATELVFQPFISVFWDFDLFSPAVSPNISMQCFRDIQRQKYLNNQYFK